MAYPNYYNRLKNFLRDALNGVSFDNAGLDGELNEIGNTYSQILAVVRGITNADGTLKNLATATAQALAGTQRLVATAAQALFQTTILYDSSFTGLNVAVYANGLKLDTNLVTPSSYVSGLTYLQVTIPAQAVNTVVVVEANSSGAGISTTLASTSAGQGASLIGVQDAGGNYAGVTKTVEAVLAYVGAQLITLNTTLTSLNTNAILKTGSVAFTANQSMGGFKLTNLAAGTAASNDAARMADITQAALSTAVNAIVSALYLPLGGGTMTGVLNMGGQKITSLANGTIVAAGTDAVNGGQLVLYLPLAGGTMTGAITLDGVHPITGLPTATSPSDAVPLSQAQGLIATFQNLTDYSAPGANSFIVPAGITKIYARCWGAGSGGASSAAGGGGGWGGAYAEAIISVTAGETLTLGIGAGGSPGLGIGGNTTIARGASVLLQSQGGQAAAGGTASSPAGNAFLGFTGGQPGPGATLSGGIFANGNGGDCPQGGSGGLAAYSSGATVGNNGVFPGGAGAGGTTGGSGAAGRIAIRY